MFGFDIDCDFIRKVCEVSGQNLRTCMQCGTCAGTCPVSDQADCSPRSIIHMTYLGMKDAVTTANTPWLCAACHACEVRCPRGLDIPRIMEAIRAQSLRANEDFVKLNEIPVEELKDLPQIAMVSSFRKHTA